MRRPKFDKILKKADDVHHDNGHGFEAEVAVYNYIKSAIPDEFERGLYKIFVYCQNVITDEELDLPEDDIDEHMELASAIYHEYDERRKTEIDSSHFDKSRACLYPEDMVTNLRENFAPLFEDHEPVEEDYICPECAKLKADGTDKKHLH